MSGIGTLSRRLIEALGADYDQWRVLSRVMWKIDLRMTGYARHGDQTRKRRVPWTLVMYGFFGVVIAFVAGAVPDLLLSGTLTLATVGTLVCSVILLEFHAVVISPDDYAILGHQPVSSRTYFLVKVTNVLAHTGLMGALVGGPSVFPFLSSYGPAVAAAWLAALAGTVTATTVAVISVYAALLRWVPPDRLSRMLSYAQLLLMSVFAAGILLSDEILAALLSVEIPERLLLLLPPAWFASLLTLASGEWGGGAVLAVLAAVASTGAFLIFASRRLSLAYAERLGELLSAGDARRGRKWMGRVAWRWFSPEFRVVATLVRAQFRHDMQFRLAVLGLLPLTGLYVFMALQDGPLPDPFIERGFATASLWLIHMAAVFMPLTLVDSFFRSDSFRAAWVFFVAPVDRARLAMKVGDSVAVFFLVPYVAFLSAILAWSFGDVWHGDRAFGGSGAVRPSGGPDEGGGGPATALLAAATQGQVQRCRVHGHDRRNDSDSGRASGDPRRGLFGDGADGHDHGRPCGGRRRHVGSGRQADPGARRGAGVSRMRRRCAMSAPAVSGGALGPLRIGGGLRGRRGQAGERGWGSGTRRSRRR